MKVWAILTALLSIVFGVYTFAWQENTLLPSLDPIHETRNYTVDVAYMINALFYTFLVLVFALRLLFKKPIARADVLDELP
jgi:hypothetical protein